jgi:hypothetical protein
VACLRARMACASRGPSGHAITSRCAQPMCSCLHKRPQSLIVAARGLSFSEQDLMTYTNLIFTVIFVAEAAVKLAAFGAKHYFRDTWNAFGAPRGCFIIYNYV